MAGGWLDNREIQEWVNQATLNIYERANAFEALARLRDKDRGLTQKSAEQLFDELVARQDILFTKYTRDRMLRDMPELPRY